MLRLTIAAIAAGALTCAGPALAEPEHMSDAQLNALTAGGLFPVINVTNVAVASNNVSTTGGSASVKCAALCLAVECSHRQRKHCRLDLSDRDRKCG